MKKFCLLNSKILEINEEISSKIIKWIPLYSLTLFSKVYVAQTSVNDSRSQILIILWGRKDRFSSPSKLFPLYQNNKSATKENFGSTNDLFIF